MRNIGAQFENRLKECDILFTGQTITRLLHRLTGLFGDRIFHDVDEVPGHIGLNTEGIFTGLNPIHLQKTFRHTLELLPCKSKRFFGLGDVGVKIRAQAGEFFAEALHFLALILRQRQSSSAIVPKNKEFSSYH